MDGARPDSCTFWEVEEAGVEAFAAFCGGVAEPVQYSTVPVEFSLALQFTDALEEFCLSTDGVVWLGGVRSTVRVKLVAAKAQLPNSSQASKFHAKVPSGMPETLMALNELLKTAVELLELACQLPANDANKLAFFKELGEIIVKLK